MPGVGTHAQEWEFSIGAHSVRMVNSVEDTYYITCRKYNQYLSEKRL